VDEIVENLRANEGLYRNIEVIFERHYRLGEPKNPRPDFVRKGETSERFVAQNGMIYLVHEEDLVNTDGKQSREDKLFGYDGQKSRLLGQKTIANIQEGLISRPPTFYPHDLSLPYHAFSEQPLSVYLAGGPELKALSKRFSQYEVKTTYVGEEDEAGLKCVKVRFDYKVGGRLDKYTSTRLFWLATDRNYLPVKTEYYRWELPISKGWKPVEVGSLRDLREIKPGIWMPMKSIVTLYDANWLEEDRRLVVNNETEIVVKKVDLEPHYDVAFFRDIEFPDGATVYNLKDGKIVKGYVKGAPAGSSSRSWRSRPWSYFAAALALSTGVVLYARYGRRKA
jgi:hypothetical protein